MNCSCNLVFEVRGPTSEVGKPKNSFPSLRSSVITRRVAGLLLGLFFFAAPRGVESASPFTIKFATLAPEGSTWMLVLREMAAEVRQRSGGRIHFVFYPGGVVGDEMDVLRKMRIGQLHGGAFSGVGLGSVLSSVRVLELPLLFRDAGEVDFVTGRVEEKFARAFAGRGFTLLTFAEAGSVHIFSKKPIRRREDLEGVKIWAWQGDPLAAALLERYQVAPVPLALPEVLPSLQTGLINAFYAPPLAAIALQWFNQVSYMSSISLTNAIGGILIASSRWNMIPPDLQDLVQEVAKKHAQRVVVKTRRENQEALRVIQQNGIRIVDLDPGEQTQLTEISRQVWEGQVGKLYPRALLNEVQSLLRQYRDQKP